MRPRTQKQPQVKKELCRALDDVDVDVDDQQCDFNFYLNSFSKRTCSEQKVPSRSNALYFFSLQYVAGVVTYPFVLVTHMMIVNHVG